MTSIPHTQSPESTEVLGIAGADMRDLALTALGNRYRVLLERSKRRELTSKERGELRGLDLALTALQHMEVATPQ